MEDWSWKNERLKDKKIESKLWDCNLQTMKLNGRDEKRLVVCTCNQFKLFISSFRYDAIRMFLGLLFKWATEVRISTWNLKFEVISVNDWINLNSWILFICSRASRSKRAALSAVMESAICMTVYQIINLWSDLCQFELLIWMNIRSLSAFVWTSLRLFLVQMNYRSDFFNLKVN